MSNSFIIPIKGEPSTTNIHNVVTTQCVLFVEGKTASNTALNKRVIISSLALLFVQRFYAHIQRDESLMPLLVMLLGGMAAWALLTTNNISISLCPLDYCDGKNQKRVYLLVCTISASCALACLYHLYPMEAILFGLLAIVLWRAMRKTNTHDTIKEKLL